MHQWRLVNQLMKHLWSFMGAIVTVAGLLSVLTSHSLKAWLKDYSYLIFIILVLSVAAAFVIIDYLVNKERRAATAHDQKLVGEVFDALPPNGSIMIWLKDQFVLKVVPVKYLDALDDVAYKMHLNVVGLDNPEANQAYRKLQDTIGTFYSLVESNLFMDGDPTVMKYAPEWPIERWRAASKQIKEARSTLIDTYDEFLRICHKNGLDP
jgi:hypothetical protein